MSLLDSILGQVTDNTTVQNLAAKVGLSPEEVEQAVAALGQAHAQEGDTFKPRPTRPAFRAISSTRSFSRLAAKGRSDVSLQFWRVKAAFLALFPSFSSHT